MMMRLALVTLAGLVVVGCNLLPPVGDPPAADPPADPGQGAGPIDGEWQLVEGVHDGGDLPVPDDAPITMSIAGNEIGGRAACNSFGGSVDVQGDHGGPFAVGDLAITEMGCDPVLMDAESAFMSALAGADTWSREDEALTLTGGGVEMAFRLIPPEPDADLTGTRWVLDGLVDADAVSSTLAGAEPATLELAADGTLTGTTGCRTFGGDWTMDGTIVSVGNLVTDDRACPDLASQDEHVLAVIASRFEVEIAGARLTLTAGRLGLTYGAEG